MSSLEIVSICVIYDIREEPFSYFSNSGLSVKNLRLGEILVRDKMYGWLVENDIILRSHSQC